MKIVYAIETPLRYGGGVSALTSTLIESFAAKHEIILLSPDRAERLRNDPLGKKIASHIPWFCKKNPPSRHFFRASREVLAQIVLARPHLVHFHSGGVFSWGNRWPSSSWPAIFRRHGIPSVWTNHLVVDLLHGYCGDRKPLCFKLAMLPLSYLGKSQQLAAGSAEICVSNHDAHKIRRWYFPFYRKVVRIYHSQLGEQDIRFSTTPREKIILAVGHLAFRKGQQILVRAFDRISRNFPDWKLVLVGPVSLDGCGAWIRDFCRRKGLESRVTLTGGRDDAREWMRRCSIFVQPSLQEALGLALQEAMACGCACIGAKVGGIPELIEDQHSGLLTEAGDVIQLAERLCDLIQQPARRQALGRAAVERIRSRQMTRGSMIQAHQKIYTALGRR